MIKGTRLNTLGNSGTHHVHSALHRRTSYRHEQAPKKKPRHRQEVVVKAVDNGGIGNWEEVMKEVELLPADDLVFEEQLASRQNGFS